MNLKNVNIIEKHLEKVVLGLAVLVALIVLFFYVLGEPYSLQIKGSQVGPDQVVGLVRGPIEQLDKRLMDPLAPDQLKQIDMAPLTARFKVRLQRDAAASDRFAYLWGQSPGVQTQDVRRLTKHEYRLPTPPGPHEVSSSATFGVLLDDDEIAELFANAPAVRRGTVADFERTGRTGHEVAQAYAGLIGPQQPRDFEGVSVMATIDGEPWQEALTGSNLPESWWRGQWFVTDVILERQVQDRTSGAWGAVVGGRWVQDQVHIVEPLPGALSFRGPVANLTPFQLRNFIRDEQVQATITQPEYAPIKGLWLPPDQQPKQRTVEQERRLLQIRKRIDDLQRQLVSLRMNVFNQMQREQERPGPRPRVERQPQPRRPRRADDNEPQQNQRNAQVARKSKSEEKQEKVQKIELELENLYAEQERLLGGDDEAEQGANGPGGRPPRRGDPRFEPRPGQLDPRQILPRQPDELQPFPGPNRRWQQRRRPGRAGQEDELLDPMKLTIWAHDLTAKAGKTYRYRLRVAVLNPLYNRDVVEEQKPLAARLGLVSRPSDWCDPIRIHPKTYFFLVGASRTDETGTVEVYRVFDGYWHREEFAIHLGEPIGGLRTLRSEELEREVDLSVGAIALDIDANASSTSAARMTSLLLYLDTEVDELQQRTTELDERNATRIYLYNQAALQGKDAEEMAMQAGR